jgi:DNA-binding NarL/FixJ family response regulator
VAVWQVAGLAGIPRGPNAHTRRNPAERTRREAQLLDLMVEGLSNPEIAERLHRSVRTVERHVSAILAKTRTRTRLEAVAWSRGRHGGRSAPARGGPPAGNGAIG